MTAIEPAARPLCTRCRSNPVLASLSICKPCLQRQADAERKEREKRMQAWTRDRRRERRREAET